MKIEELKDKLNSIVDPSANQTLEQLNSIKKVFVTSKDVVRIDFTLTNQEDYEAVKLEIAKLVKLKLGFPGLKLNLLLTEEQIEKEKENPSVKYLAIASGKGGVGKSTVTANLAIALSKLGKKVGIIDSDIYGASIPFVLDMEVKPLDLNEEGEIIPAKYMGVEIISTEFFMPKDKPLMWRGPLVSQMTNMFFKSVSWDDDIDYILIDLPPGTGDIAIDVRELVPKSDMLIITNPNQAAANIAVKAGLGSREIGHNVIGVVENMSYYYNQCNNKREYLFGKGGGNLVASKLDVDLIAEIPIGRPNESNTLYGMNTIQGKMYMKIASDYIKGCG